MKKILVAGCGYWQVPLLRKAKEMGLTVVGMDPHPKCEGRKLCHQFYVGDVRSYENIYEIAKKEKVNGIITGTDLGTVAVARVCEDLGLPTLSSRVIESVTFKDKMRKRLQDNDLFPPKFWTVDLKSTVPQFPCVVKPVDNCGSRGVSVVTSKSEYVAALKLALENSFSRQAIVEEFMVGQEFSVEIFVHDSNIQVVGIADKIKSELPYRYDLELHYPARVPTKVREEIKAFAIEVVKSFKIDRGPVHLEVLYDKRPRLIELAVRGCGAFVATQLLQAMTGFDYARAWIQIALGLKNEESIRQSRNGRLIFFTTSPGVVTRIEGLEEIRKRSDVLFADVTRSVGETIKPAVDTSGRIGHALLIAETLPEIEEAVRKVTSLLVVETSNRKGA